MSGMRKAIKNSRRYDVLRAIIQDPRATIREIMEATGISSSSVVSYHLDQLEKEGKIHREHRKARGIYVTDGQRPPAEHAPQYSTENYQKKSAAGRKGRGASAGKAFKRNADIDARIEEIGLREDARVGQSSTPRDDVVHGVSVYRFSSLRASKVG